MISSLSSIRWLIRRDMPAVLAIENATSPHPWPEDEFLRVLRQRNTIGMVAERGDDIAGFMVYDLRKSCIDVLNFAVHPNYRRLGVGRQMVDKLKSKLQVGRRVRLEVVVRETNMDAQWFFAACGFKAYEVLRGHFGDSGEDGFAFEYSAIVPLRTKVEVMG